MSRDLHPISRTSLKGRSARATVNLQLAASGQSAVQGPAAAQCGRAFCDCAVQPGALRLRGTVERSAAAQRGPARSCPALGATVKQVTVSRFVGKQS